MVNTTETMQHLWTQITPSPLFGVTLTVLVYAIGLAIQRACGGAASANPVLISILVISCLLKATGTSYQTYFAGGQFIHFLLGPATVALAVPLVKNLEHLKRNLLGVVLGVTIVSLVSIVSGFALVELCGGTRQVALSMAPKAVTSPIAIDVAQAVPVGDHKWAVGQMGLQHFNAAAGHGRRSRIDEVDGPILERASSSHHVAGGQVHGKITLEFSVIEEESLDYFPFIA